MKLARNSFVKFLSAVLAIASLTVFAVSLLATVVTYACGGYDSDATYDSMFARLAHGTLYTDLYEAADYYAMTTDPAMALSQELADREDAYAPENTNFFFSVVDADTGEVLLQNYTDEALLTHSTDCSVVTGDYASLYGPVNFHPTLEYEAALDEAQVSYRTIRIYGYVRAEVWNVYDEYTELYRLSSLLFSVSEMAAIATGVSALVALGSLIFLLYGAGRRKGTEEISLSIVDRIPADLFLLLTAGIVFGGVLLFFLTSEDYFFGVAFTRTTFILTAVWALPAATLLTLFLSSFAARFKAKRWWRNTLVWRVWNWFGELLHHPIRNLFQLLRQLHLVWKVAVAGVLIAIVEFWCLDAFYRGFFGPMVLFNLAIALLIAYCTVCMARLRDDCKAVAAGDLSHPVDTRGMVLDFKVHGEDLGRIREGISVAVEDRLKSERFKTELITNVSHDLKTPLTSIVNYVDLLSRLELPDQAREYVEVLRRQSARLKKLTEDLVEASKASTGSLTVERLPVRLDELMAQVTAEYADRFEAANLHGVAQLPDAPLTVAADGRYLWRVMDNLLSNVCKYAMPGTRVYITAQACDGRAVLSVKNISRERLNISADELMERFVRGDASRNTEGSGLGLSIAQSLCALMAGELRLTVDGDLFKAEVDLPLMEE